MFKKRAQGLSINTIIIAVIALIVLVVLIAILTGKLGAFSSGVEGGESTGQSLINKIKGKFGGGSSGSSGSGGSGSGSGSCDRARRDYCEVPFVGLTCGDGAVGGVWVPLDNCELVIGNSGSYYDTEPGKVCCNSGFLT